VLIAALSLCGVSPGQGEDKPKAWSYLAHELVTKEGKLDPEIPKEIQRHLEIVEDGETESGKALLARVPKRLILKEDVPLLKTPGIPMTESGPGLYRVTVRLKLEGMLNVIGTPILFGRLRLHGFQFKEQGAYQEFSFLQEVIEPDHVCKRPKQLSPEGALGQSPWRVHELRKRLELHTKPGHDINKEYLTWDRDGYVWKEYGWTKVGERPERPVWLENKTLVVPLTYAQTSPKGKSFFGFDGVANTIQSVTIDWLKIKRVEEPASVTVRQVLPRRIWVRPGDSQHFTVWLHNRSGKSQTGELVLSIEHGLNSAKDIARREVALSDGEYRLEALTWDIPKDHPMWGMRVLASFVQGGEVRSKADEVFSIHQNPWAVMNFGGKHRRTEPYFEPVSYRNYVENFGISPADSVQPYPDKPELPYLTGMSGYATHMDLQKAMADWNRFIGLGTFMYLSPLATSHRAELHYLKHPEWYSSRISWTDEANDQWVLGEKLLTEGWLSGQPPKELPKLFHIETGLNFNYEDLVLRTIEQSVQVIDHVGYDGIRGDGLPMALAGGNSLGEPTGPADPMERKKKSAELLRRMRSRIREKHPDFVWGSNGDLYGVCNSLISRKVTPPNIEDCPDFTAMFEGGNLQGGSLMDEGWMNAYLYMDSRNIIRDYFWACRQECDFTRQVGGFFHTFSPQRDGTGHFVQSDIYYNLLTILAGAQYPGCYSATPGSETGSAHFITRFSEFLWDCELKWLRDAGKKIRVDSPTEVWFDETVVWKDLPDGRRRYVIPLVNPPTTERFYKDRFSELPEPLKEPFSVEVAMPEGFRKAEVWMLTAEPRTLAVKLESAVAGNTVSFKVPDLIIYRVIVVEFGR
jgi:hypothetical protein